jgi:DNA repair protein RAD5
MKMRENRTEERNIRLLRDLFNKQQRQMHPLWQERKTKNNISFYFNTFTAQISFNFPRAFDGDPLCGGGILADQMGLGKTIMLLSLILDKVYFIKLLTLI